MKRKRTARDIKAVADAIDYNPETGVAVWAGTETVCTRVDNSEGRYLRVVIQYKDNTYVAARVFYYKMTGEQPDQVDHKDTDSQNNRWVNLRAATGHQNQRNRGKNANNSSGYKGVSFMSARGKWRAVCCGKHLGVFDTAEQANTAVVEYRTREHGQFVHN